MVRFIDPFVSLAGIVRGTSTPLSEKPVVLVTTPRMVQGVVL
jgi:hypothetical protein